MDKQKTETLEQRIGREAVEWRERWEVCRGNVEDSDIAAVRPLVERIDGLESDLKTARDSGQAYADKLTAAQTAGRDQASEIASLRAEIEKAQTRYEDLDQYAKGIRADFLSQGEELGKERQRLTVALRNLDALDITIDVLAGRLAARGQS